MQRVYGLNIDEAGERYSIYHLASLVAFLPHDSNTYMAIEPESQFGLLEMLLVRIEHDLSIGNWLNSRDGEKGINRPKPLFSPRKKVSKQREALTVEELERRLALPREEVKDIG